MMQIKLVRNRSGNNFLCVVYCLIFVAVAVSVWDVGHIDLAYVRTKGNEHAHYLINEGLFMEHRNAAPGETSLGPEGADNTADETNVVDDSDRTTEPNFHTVFSTGCNAFQDWQSYVFFYQAWKSGQLGHVTRVASGCKDEAEAAALTRTFEEQILTIPTAADRFHLHLTPDFALPQYHFSNKPCGLRHWMEEGLGFPENLSKYKDVVFIILDPDQIILRPFTTTDFGNDPTVRWSQGASQRHEDYVVTEGRPFSQVYLFGAHWINDVNVDVQRVVRAALNATGSSADAEDKSSSHLYSWTEQEVFQSYMGGPPYIAVASDMYKIASVWAAVMAPILELTKSHVSEMHAYSTAAAHVELPHTLAYSFMVSSPGVSNEEGWATVDELESEQVCQHVSSVSSDPEDVAWRATLPHILHYCQRYALGPYVFFKYYLPKTFLTCEHPLMVDPAEEDDIVLKYNYSLLPDGTHNEISPIVRKRQAFFLCHLVARINEASIYWKTQHCKAEKANFSKDFVFPKR